MHYGFVKWTQTHMKNSYQISLNIITEKISLILETICNSHGVNFTFCIILLFFLFIK